MNIRDNLYCGDCLEVMQDIPDASVDMVLCDLPYGILNKGNSNAKWDNVIPFEPLWKQYLRICKDNAAIVLFASGMFTAKLMMSQPKLWRYNLIWDKVLSTGFLNANRMPLRCHEDILVFYRRLPVYHPQMEKAAPHARNHSRGSKYKTPTNSCYGKFESMPTVISDEKFPRSIVRVSCVNRQEKKLHPSAKPVDLLRWLIRTYTDVNALVLDNCMGSGSTCVAAIEENRHYIGIEKEQTFFDVACKRIKTALQEPTLKF